MCDNGALYGHIFNFYGVFKYFITRLPAPSKFKSLQVFVLCCINPVELKLFFTFNQCLL